MKRKPDIKRKNSLWESIFNKNVAILAFILIMTFAGYYKTKDFELLTWDDDKQITNNQFIKKFDNETFLSLYHFDRYTSVTLLTFAWEYKNNKLDPRSYHLHNIYLHLINILLVFFFIRKLFGKDHLALICALLFAFHPSRVESVSWVSERKDLLFTMFSLVSMLFYIKYLSNGLKILYLMLFILTSYLAVHSKLQGIALIPLFFLLDYYYQRKLTILSVYEKFFIFFLAFVFLFDYLYYLFNLTPVVSAFFILLIIYSSRKTTNPVYRLYIVPLLLLISIYYSRKTMMMVPFFIWYLSETYLFDKKEFLAKIKFNLIKFRHFILVSFSLAVIISAFVIRKHFALWSPVNNPTTEFFLFDRIFLGAGSLLFYTGLFIFPFRLNSIHPYPPKTGGMLPYEYYISLIICILILGFVTYFIYRKKLIYKREIIFCLLFFLINISLVLHIIPIQGRIVFADRYSYFAFIGLFAVTGVLYEEWRTWFLTRKWLGIVAGIYVAGMAAYSFVRTDTWKDSLTLFTEVLQKNPDVSIAHNNIGAAMLKFGKKKETMYHLNRSIELDPVFHLAHYNRAMAFYKFKDYQNAEKELIWLNNRQIDSLDKSINYNDLGMIKLETGNLEEASELLEKAKKLHPKFAKLYNNTGWLKFLQNDFKGAIEDFNKCISIDPSMDEAISNRGWCRLKSGDAHGAIDDFNMAVTVNPLNAKALTNRGTIKTNLKDYEGAVTDLSRAINIDPSFEIAYANRGFTYYNLGDLKNTIKDYTSAIGLNPGNPDYYSNRGWAYFQSGNTSKALEDFNMSVALGGKSEATYANRGIINQKAGNTNQALDDINKALSLNPGSWKGNFYKGVILFDKKDFAGSLLFLNKSIQINQNSSEAFYYRGECYIKLGKPKEACLDFERSSKMGYEKASAVYNSECKNKKK